MSLIYAPINELPFAPNFEGNDYLLIWDISQPANQARRLTFTALASFLAYTSREFEWADIINKPDTFPPAVHTHIPADISGLNGAIDARLNNLPNGAIIGGVAHFFQNTPPATRIDGSPSVIDGSPLVIGDRWYRPSMGQEGFWNGTLWLSTKQIVFTRYRIVSNSSNLAFPTTVDLDGQDVPMNAPIFLESVSYAVTLLTTGDENNYRAFRIQRRTTTGSAITVYDSPVKLFDSSVRQQIYEPINLFSSGTPGQPLVQEFLGYTFSFAAFGTAPNGTNPSATLKFREILS